MSKKTVLCIIGTRPEAIKMAPIINALKQTKELNVKVLATAQHRDLLDQVNIVFDVVPDHDLNLMKSNQGLNDLLARILSAMDTILVDLKPDAVIAQGDTTTVLASAISAFHRNIPFGHVEAGLRSKNINSPFPEEANRILAGRLAKWHFAPTESARTNLLAEGFNDSDIYVVGNTVIDALLNVAGRDLSLPEEIHPDKPLILVTAHRRENFGQPFRNICAAIKRLAAEYPYYQILYPVHPNPNVVAVVEEVLGALDNVILTKPLEYEPFIAVMKKAHLILTDSGGVQEEAPALSTPVLVMRQETERPEAVDAGVVKLVGTDEDIIYLAAKELLDDDAVYRSMAIGASPYGDGKSASRIVNILRRDLLGA